MNNTKTGSGDFFAVLPRGFFTASSVIFAGSFVVNVLNYVFTLLVSRLLGVDSFGEVTALFSLLLIISVPSSALSMLMTREVAAQSAERSPVDLFIYLRRHVLLVSLALWGVFLLCTPLLAAFLHAPISYLLIFSLLVPLSGAGALQTGTIQGLQEFFLLAKQNVLSAVIKLLLSLLLIYMGFSVAGVLTALVVAQTTQWLYGYYHTRRLMQKHEPLGETVDAARIRSVFMTILVTSFLLVLLTSLDVLLAKHYLGSFEAGEYGALSTAGKIIFYGIGAFATVLLPMAAAAHARGEGEERKLLLVSMGVILVATLGCSLVFFVVPGPIVHVLFGSRYEAIVAPLGLYALAMGAVALSTTLINFFIAVGNTSFMYLLGISIALETLAIMRFHDSIMHITLALLFSMTLLIALLGLNFLFFRRSAL